MNLYENIKKNLKESAGQPAYVICYGQLEIWPNVERAKSFYREGMDMCEGAEQERYMNIVYSLGHGNFFADDLGPEKVTAIVDRDENGNIKTERVNCGAMTHEQAIDYITRLQNMNINEAESTNKGLKMPQDDEWITGEVTINNKPYYIQGKVYEEPSSYGIDDGQVSKLWVHEMNGKDLGKEIIAYDRGWDKEPKDKKLLQEVLKLLVDFRSKNHYLEDWELEESQKIKESDDEWTDPNYKVDTTNLMLTNGNYHNNSDTVFGRIGLYPKNDKVIPGHYEIIYTVEDGKLYAFEPGSDVRHAVEWLYTMDGTNDNDWIKWNGDRIQLKNLINVLEEDAITLPYGQKESIEAAISNAYFNEEPFPLNKVKYQ